MALAADQRRYCPDITTGQGDEVTLQRVHRKRLNVRSCRLLRPAGISREAAAGAGSRLRLMDRHYGHAVTTQADIVSRRHLQVAFPRDMSCDAGGNDTGTHEVIAHRLRP